MSYSPHNLVNPGDVRTDEDRRRAEVVDIWRVPAIGVCVKAHLTSADRRDKRRHTYMGPLKLFIQRFPEGGRA